MILFWGFKIMSFKMSFKIKSCLFVIFLISGCFIDVFAQNNDLGTPFIQNYSPKDYGYESQVYSIVQDNKGVIYFGSLNGVIEYDGAYWNVAHLDGKVKLAQNKDGIVFFGGYNEFGCILRTYRDAKGIKKTIIFPEKFRSDGIICYRVAIMGIEWIFMISRKSRNHPLRILFLRDNGELPIFVDDIHEKSLLLDLAKKMKNAG